MLSRIRFRCDLSGLFWCAMVSIVISQFSAAAMAQTSDENDTEIIQPPEGGINPREERPDFQPTVKLLLDQTNDFRVGQGQRKLSPNAQLQATAQDFAAYMAQNDRYGHYADGQRPSDRVTKHGYKYFIIAENIAYAYDSEGFASADLASRLVNGWEKSPPHRKNMLDPDVFDIGVGLAYSAKTDHYYAVQLFGRPTSKNIKFSIFNNSQLLVRYELGGRNYTLPPRYTRTHELGRPSELTFLWNGNQNPQENSDNTVQIADGARYVIVQDQRGNPILKRN